MADKKSSVVILKDYFGLHPNETLSQFLGEIKALSPKDKLELVEGAAKNMGVECSDIDALKALAV